MTRTLSIAIKENTYQELKQLVGHGKISSFVNQAVDKELKELVREQQQAKEQLKKRLIKGYQVRAKNEKLRKTLLIYGEMSWKDFSTKPGEREKKNDK